VCCRSDGISKEKPNALYLDVLAKVPDFKNHLVASRKAGHHHLKIYNRATKPVTGIHGNVLGKQGNHKIPRVSFQMCKYFHYY